MSADRTRWVVRPGTAPGLDARDPADTSGAPGGKHATQTTFAALSDTLLDLQERLYAESARSLLVVLQAMDAGGKDGTIKHVFRGLNPQGVRVTSFKAPTPQELEHDFLWRIAKAAPAHGRIGIFNRSHYEEVIALRVHPEWLAAQRLPTGPEHPGFWEERYEDINAFERHLARTGTTIVKFFLNVSKAEQKRRFLARLDDAQREWTFNADDVAERRHWDEYIAAYEAALTATSTPWAPWYVIPADHKSLTQALVAAILVHTIDGLDLRWPTMAPGAHEANVAARRALEAEQPIPA